MKPENRRMVRNLIVVCVLFVTLVLLLSKNLEALLNSLQQLSLSGLLLLLAVGAVYQLLDAAARLVLLRGEYPQLTYRNAFDLTMLGQFAAVTTFSAGIGPLQSWYLHRCGVKTGAGLGCSAFSYVLHKVSVLLYGMGMLLAALVFFPQSLPLVRPYLLIGFALGGGSAVGLLLLCTWDPLRRLLRRLAALLPEKGKWPARRQALNENLDALYYSTRQLLQDRTRCVRVIGVSFAKLAVLYTLPVLCLHSMGCDVLTLGQGQILSAFMLLLAGALPNVAGMGSAEYSFMQLYSPFTGQEAAAAAMLLYRLASWLFPFVVSALVFWLVQRRLGGETQG